MTDSKQSHATYMPVSSPMQSLFRILLFSCILIISSVAVLGLDVSTFTPTSNAFLSSSDLFVEVFIDAPLGNTVICDYKTNETGAFITREQDVTVTAGSTAVFASSSLSDDLYRWSVNCTDTTASATAQTGLNTVTLDTVIPTVTLLTPADGTIIESTNDITFTGSATDSNPDSCILYTDYNGTLQAESVLNTGNFNSILFTLTDLSDTPVTWDIKCTDKAGNQAFSGDSYSFEVDYVNDVPQISLTSPQYVPQGMTYSRDIGATDHNPSDVLSYFSTSSAYTMTAGGLVTNNNPSQSENVTITVCDDSNAVNNCTAKVIEFKVRQPIRQLNITQPHFASELKRFKNYSATITLENSGDFTLSDIKVLSTADLSYHVNVTGVPATLDPGDSASVVVTITVPEDIDSGRTEIGTIYAQAENIVYDTEELVLDVNNELIISNFDITGKNIETYRDLESNREDIEVHPGDSVDISFEVENGYTTEEDIGFDSVVATWTIDSFGDMEADDDLDYEFNSFELDPEDDRTLTYSFTVPYAIEDDVDYEVELEIIAEDDEGNEHNYTWTSDFVGVRDSDEVRIINYELTTDAVECRNGVIERIGFRGEIMNIGDSEQENMYAELYVPEIDNTLQTFEFTLSEDPDDDDNVFVVDYVFSFEKETQSDRYYVYLDVYSEFNDLEDKIALPFDLETCQQTPQPQDDDDTQDEQEEEQETDDEVDQDPTSEEDSTQDEPQTEVNMTITDTEMISLVEAFEDEINEANYTITKQSVRTQNITATQATVQTLLNLSQTFTNETIAALEDIDRLVAENQTAFIPLVRTVSVYQLENSTTERTITSISYSFTTNRTVGDVQVIELVPKTYAQNVSEITFGNREPVILDSDPALQWNIRKVQANSSDQQITYYLDGDHDGFSASTLGVANANAAFFVDYLPFIGIALGAIILLGGLGFGTVLAIRFVLSDETGYHESQQSSPETTTYRNIYQEGAPVKKRIQLPGLPELETEVDPVSGRVKSDLEL